LAAEPRHLTIIEPVISFILQQAFHIGKMTDKTKWFRPADKNRSPETTFLQLIRNFREPF
jgi:hypothetical protein